MSPKSPNHILRWLYLSISLLVVLVLLNLTTIYKGSENFPHSGESTLSPLFIKRTLAVSVEETDSAYLLTPVTTSEGLEFPESLTQPVFVTPIGIQAGSGILTDNKGNYSVNFTQQVAKN
jgi:hypothetical protein